MSESLAAITAATIPLQVDGKYYNFRPLTIELMGQSCQRYTDAMLPTLLDPKDAAEALKGHDASVVIAALKECQRERHAVMNPNPLVVIDWILKDPLRLVELLADCVEGDAKPNVQQVVLALNTKEGELFIDQWLLASGLAADPTKRPSGPQKASRRTAKKADRSTSAS